MNAKNLDQASCDQSSGDTLINRKSLLTEFAGDEDILKTAIQGFAEQGEQKMEHIKALMHANDQAGAKAAIHSLKGEIFNFQSNTVSNQIKALEEAVVAGITEDVKHHAANFHLTLTQFIKELLALNKVL